MNTNELKAELARKDMRINELANRIGISNTALYRKINRESEFKLSEISKITNALGITAKRRDEIFFNDNVS